MVLNEFIRSFCHFLLQTSSKSFWQFNEIFFFFLSLDKVASEKKKNKKRENVKKAKYFVEATEQ